MTKMPIARRTEVPGDYARRWVRVPRRRLSATSLAKLAQTREKEAQALELRKAGVTYGKIAETVGYKNPEGARQAVKRAIDRLAIEPAMEVVSISLATLDELQMRVMAAFRAGDISQADRIMRIMMMRHDLLGVTSETFKEEAAKKAGVSITNNAVMVVQGSESDFVRSMMAAVGMNVNDPKNTAYLERLQQKNDETPREIVIQGEAVETQRSTAIALPSAEDRSDRSEEGGGGSSEPPLVYALPIHNTLEEAMAAQKSVGAELKARILKGEVVPDETQNVEYVPEIPALYEGDVEG